MQKPRGRAGARQRGGDLAADDSRLAHAGDDDAAAALEEEANRPLEVAVEAVEKAEDGGRLGLQDLARQVQAVDGAVHTMASRPIAWILTSRCSSGSSLSR